MGFISQSDLRKTYTDSHKLSDYNHSLWAYFVLRPSAYLLTPFFLRAGISATGVTLIGFGVLLLGLMVLGTAGSVAAAVGGAILLNAFCVLDFVDGNIARYKRSESNVGEFLDFSAGICFHSVLPFAVAGYLVRGDFQFPAVLSGGGEYAAHVAWWVAGSLMCITFLMRRVVSQKLLISFSGPESPGSRQPGWQVLLRSIEAFKTPLLVLAPMVGQVGTWLIGYAAYGAITLAGALFVGFRRTRALDGSR